MASAGWGLTYVCIPDGTTVFQGNAVLDRHVDSEGFDMDDRHRAAEAEQRHQRVYTQ